MKPWIKKALVGLFGASIMAGGLAACSSGGHHAHHGAMTAEKMAELAGDSGEVSASRPGTRGRPPPPAARPSDRLCSEARR